MMCLAFKPLFFMGIPKESYMPPKLDKGTMIKYTCTVPKLAILIFLVLVWNWLAVGADAGESLIKKG